VGRWGVEGTCCACERERDGVGRPGEVMRKIPFQERNEAAPERHPADCYVCEGWVDSRTVTVDNNVGGPPDLSGTSVEAAPGKTTPCERPGKR
jgi:hypothetical protein